MDNIDEAIQKLLDTDQQELVLLNDNYNTINNVVSCLSCYLHMDAIQAEQCATIAHYKDEYTIMTGKRQDLVFLRDRLKYHRINAKIR